MYVTEYISFPVKQEKERHGDLWSHFLMYCLEGLDDSDEHVTRKGRSMTGFCS